MRRIWLFVSVEELSPEDVNKRDAADLLQLEERLDRKKSFFISAFAIAVFFCVMTTFAYAKTTGDNVALLAAIVVPVAGFYSFMCRRLLRIVEREWDRRQIERQVARAKEGDPSKP